MQTVYKSRKNAESRVCVVSESVKLGVWGFGSVPRFRGVRGHLLTILREQKGGTVVPPCVFHYRITDFPLFKRVFDVFSSRTPAPACAQAHTRDLFPGSF